MSAIGQKRTLGFMSSLRQLTSNRVIRLWVLALLSAILLWLVESNSFGLVHSGLIFPLFLVIPGVALAFVFDASQINAAVFWAAACLLNTLYYEAICAWFRAMGRASQRGSKPS